MGGTRARSRGEAVAELLDALWFGPRATAPAVAAKPSAGILTAFSAPCMLPYDADDEFEARAHGVLCALTEAPPPNAVETLKRPSLRSMLARASSPASPSHTGSTSGLTPPSFNSNTTMVPATPPSQLLLPILQRRVESCPMPNTLAATTPPKQHPAADPIADPITSSSSCCSSDTASDAPAQQHPKQLLLLLLQPMPGQVHSKSAPSVQPSLAAEVQERADALLENISCSFSCPFNHYSSTNILSTSSKDAMAAAGTATIPAQQLAQQQQQQQQQRSVVRVPSWHRATFLPLPQASKAPSVAAGTPSGSTPHSVHDDDSDTLSAALHAAASRSMGCSDALAAQLLALAALPQQEEEEQQQEQQGTQGTSRSAPGDISTCAGDTSNTACNTACGLRTAASDMQAAVAAACDGAALLRRAESAAVAGESSSDPAWRRRFARRWCAARRVSKQDVALSDSLDDPLQFLAAFGEGMVGQIAAGSLSAYASNDALSGLVSGASNAVDSSGANVQNGSTDAYMGSFDMGAGGRAAAGHAAAGASRLGGDGGGGGGCKDGSSSTSRARGRGRGRGTAGEMQRRLVVQARRAACMLQQHKEAADRDSDSSAAAPSSPLSPPRWAGAVLPSTTIDGGLAAVAGTRPLPFVVAKVQDAALGHERFVVRGARLCSVQQLVEALRSELAAAAVKHMLPHTASVQLLGCGTMALGADRRLSLHCSPPSPPISSSSGRSSGGGAGSAAAAAAAAAAAPLMDAHALKSITAALMCNLLPPDHTVAF